MKISSILNKAKSSFLQFWGGRTNRTTVQNLIVVTGEESKPIRVPDGTFSFEIYGTANDNTEFEMIFPTGIVYENATATVATKPPLRKVCFCGVPYLERSDTFSLKNVGLDDITFVITYHKVMKANT